MPEYIVRYGAMHFLGVFTIPSGLAVRRNNRVIARTDRGLESGEVLCEASPETVARLVDPPSGQILRIATAEDINEQSRIAKHARAEMDICQTYVDKLELKMQLVDVEHIFGGERIVIYYLAENRVDFRELVRQLAAEFQTRIEMRQIGVRDEAKLLADYGDCGCTVCCNSHLIEMPPVSMRMAKLQKATLDPTKISGRCGRLKCCLRYEFDTYEEMLKILPSIGAMVETSEGQGKVVGHEILGGNVQVVLEDQRRILVPMDQVKLLKSTQPNKAAPNGETEETPKEA
ncbi:MAG: signal peptidase [Pirellulales bacterium]|nr:signal peptidase [Pirellulales bacterium]